MAGPVRRSAPDRRDAPAGRRHAPARAERSTPQLEAVYRAVEAVRDHPNARQVFERVRGEMPRISLGTVYRNLEKLSRLGRIRVLRPESGGGLYDAVAQVHDHFICDECGTVIDVDIGAAGVSVDASLERLGGHRVRRSSTTLYGTCRACVAGRAAVADK